MVGGSGEGEGISGWVRRCVEHKRQMMGQTLIPKKVVIPVEATSGTDTVA